MLGRGAAAVFMEAWIVVTDYLLLAVAMAAA
jgi:hypothetical protein